MYDIFYFFIIGGLFVRLFLISIVINIILVNEGFCNSLFLLSILVVFFSIRFFLFSMIKFFFLFFNLYLLVVMVGVLFKVVMMFLRDLFLLCIVRSFFFGLGVFFVSYFVLIFFIV